MSDPVFDNGQAIDEGWSIFDCSGSENGRWQLQKSDELAVFSNDMAAWRHVVRRAAAGSKYHQDALSFLETHNPLEYGTIIDTVTGKACA